MAASNQSENPTSGCLVASLSRVFASPRPVARILKGLLVAAMMMGGSSVLVKAIEWLFPPNVYRKDFVQEYLLARAVWGGVNPYLALPELGAQFLPSYPGPLFPHPTPHPPPVALVALPFGLLPYEYSQGLWLMVAVTCLAATSWFLATTWDAHPSVARVGLIAVAALPLLHFREELALGQLMSLLLLLLAGAWRTLRSGRELSGGMLLGLAVAFKLMLWPVVLFLAVRRQWKAVLAAVVACGVANLLAAALIGLREVAYYYSVVSQTVWAFHRAQEGNFSLAGIGWRLFDGTGSSVFSGIQAPPLVFAPHLAPVASLAVVVVLLVIGLGLATAASSFDAAFSTMIYVSILISPIAWCHYLVLLAVPLTIAVRQVASQGISGWRALALGTAVGLLSIPATVIHDIIAQFAVPGELSIVSPHVSFVASLIDLVPAVAVIALLLQIWFSDRLADSRPRVDPVIDR